MKIPKQAERDPNAPQIDFNPTEATHNAVCVGGWYCGEFPPFKEGGKNKHAFVIMFEVDEIIEAPTMEQFHGKRKTIVTEWNIRTWNEGSFFFKDIVGWLGRELSDQQLENFNGYTLRGIPAMVSVKHNKGGDGKLYANISNIVYPPKGMQLLTVLRNMVAPDWIIKKIDKSVSNSLEKMKLKNFALDPGETGVQSGVYANAPDDDLPF